ncbi:MAG: methyltransferase domain-containing protein [Pyrinomonadaceae bacterium]
MRVPVSPGAPRSDVLNLGCGRKPVAGAFNVDAAQGVGADLVCDLNVRPWPFPSDHFREVLAYDVVEHLDELVAVFEEIHRVCRDGAIVRITVPHYSSPEAFTDPTHRHFFAYSTFEYFTEASELSYYTRARFRLRRRSIIFMPSLVNKLVWRLANRYPARYERSWAWIFPAWFLSVELEVLKDASAPGGDGDGRRAGL